MSRTLEALQIIESRGRVTCSEFAVLFWPDHNMHKKVSNQGNGAARGKAAWLCAGSYLAKLIKKGYVTHDYEIPQCRRLTSEGRKYLTHQLK